MIHILRNYLIKLTSISKQSSLIKFKKVKHYILFIDFLITLLKY